MAFFDDKQEILKVELTTYGRYALSKGKFKPAFYAFFDDDILYDSEYTGLSEEQGEVQTRLLDETIFFKPQTTYTSVENRAKITSLLPGDLESLAELEKQIVSDKYYSLNSSLGDSSANSDYAPAWSLVLLEGEISGAITRYVDNGSGEKDTLLPFLQIPQINLKDQSYDIHRQINDDDTPLGYQLITVATDEKNNLYYYSMTDRPIIIEFSEDNVAEALKRFDIELFVEEDEIIPGTSQTKTALRQLNFKKNTLFIEDGVLLDEPKEYMAVEDEEFAEFFFEITVDEEIELPPRSQGPDPYAPGTLPRGPFGDKC